MGIACTITNGESVTHSSIPTQPKRPEYDNVHNMKAYLEKEFALDAPFIWYDIGAYEQQGQQMSFTIEGKASKFVFTIWNI